MGRRASPWGRAGRVVDADGCCFCLTTDAQARSHIVPILAGWVLELQNQYQVSCQCLWFVLRLIQASRQVVVAPHWCVASCAFVGIESQGLAKPCSTDLSVPLDCG